VVFYAELDFIEDTHDILNVRFLCGELVVDGQNTSIFQLNSFRITDVEPIPWIG
jgi:hypothetical protein